MGLTGWSSKHYNHNLSHQCAVWHYKFTLSCGNSKGLLLELCETVCKWFLKSEHYELHLDLGFLCSCEDIPLAASCSGVLIFIFILFHL